MIACAHTPLPLLSLKTVCHSARPYPSGFTLQSSTSAMFPLVELSVVHVLLLKGMAYTRRCMAQEWTAMQDAAPHVCLAAPDLTGDRVEGKGGSCTTPVTKSQVYT
ncbi:hypothetical protein AAFF_G00207330 [Aldrovandia affinis]|uniref:Uncharacterized protein n=1 Tax=Aldrovandia affinis TaxID=143900 RepID=A0AAD7RHN5_9TELE|nr:hypothetical protein AAFF_G00207330 [Aldrovandia affinis]